MRGAEEIFQNCALSKSVILIAKTLQIFTPSSRCRPTLFMDLPSDQHRQLDTLLHRVLRQTSLLSDAACEEAVVRLQPSPPSLCPAAARVAACLARPACPFAWVPTASGHEVFAAVWLALEQSRWARSALFLHEMGAVRDSSASRSLPQFLDFVALCAAAALAPGVPLSDDARQKWMQLQASPERSQQFSPDELEAVWRAVAAHLNTIQATKLSVYQLAEAVQDPDCLHETHAFGECVEDPHRVLNFLCWNDSASILHVDLLVMKASQTHASDDDDNFLF